jgi:hypothetical protein
MDVLSLAVSGTNLFAGTWGGGVFLSTDNGTNWTEVNTGLTNTNVRAFVVTSTNLFAGTDGGVFLSTDNGTSWTAVNSGLTNLLVYSLAISGTNLFAGTIGSGVWSQPLGLFNKDNQTLSSEIPNSISLSQNYPNPFNPSTTIRYSIPISEFVTLKIYDVLGNEIVILVNEDKPAGSYEVEFDAAVLVSGIYFYKLQAGNFIEMKKMILMK